MLLVNIHFIKGKDIKRKGNSFLEFPFLFFFKQIDHLFRQIERF